jgi:hypothetical protein
LGGVEQFHLDRLLGASVPGLFRAPIHGCCTVDRRCTQILERGLRTPVAAVRAACGFAGGQAR